MKVGQGMRREQNRAVEPKRNPRLVRPGAESFKLQRRHNDLSRENGWVVPQSEATR